MWRAYSYKKACIIQQRNYWKSYRLLCKEKRKDNFNKSLKILADANISFTITADKCCIITTNKGTINFYPTTGTFTGLYNGRGVKALLEKIL